jgi:hypothetical protein
MTRLSSGSSSAGVAWHRPSRRGLRVDKLAAADVADLGHDRGR